LNTWEERDDCLLYSFCLKGLIKNFVKFLEAHGKSIGKARLFRVDMRCNMCRFSGEKFGICNAHHLANNMNHLGQNYWPLSTEQSRVAHGAAHDLTKNIATALI